MPNNIWGYSTDLDIHRKTDGSVEIKDKTLKLSDSIIELNSDNKDDTDFGWIAKDGTDMKGMIHNRIDGKYYLLNQPYNDSNDITPSTTSTLVANIEGLATGGITSHTGLSDIGTLTHDAIETSINDNSSSISTNSSTISTHIGNASLHRTIDDGSTSTTNLWSANKINNELTGKSNSNHTHLSADITDLDSSKVPEATNLYYTDARVNSNSNVIDSINHIANGTLHFTEVSIDHDNILNSGITSHASIDSHITNSGIHREINDIGTGITELWSASKINTELGLKANTSHTHLSADITDLDSSKVPEATNLYYTEARVDANSNVVNSINHIADATLHRVINDATTTTTNLWSASKINSEITTGIGNHTHSVNDITFDAGFVPTTQGTLNIGSGVANWQTIHARYLLCQLGNIIIGANTSVNAWLELDDSKIFAYRPLRLALDTAVSPSIATAGALYYKTSDNTIQLSDGASWSTVGSGTYLPLSGGAMTGDISSTTDWNIQRSGETRFRFGSLLTEAKVAFAVPSFSGAGPKPESSYEGCVGYHTTDKAIKFCNGTSWDKLATISDVAYGGIHRGSSLTNVSVSTSYTSLLGVSANLFTVSNTMPTVGMTYNTAPTISPTHITGIVIANTGVYELKFHMTLNPTGSPQIDIFPFINGSAGAVSTNTISTQAYCCSFSLIANITAGWVVDLRWIASSANTADIYSSQFTINRIV